jgi:UDP-N-acetylmuramate--alanine ligase
MIVQLPASYADRRLRSPRRCESLPYQSAHLVGICGSGMQALAEMLVGLGCQVSGSDLQPASPVIDLMRSRGLRIHQGHNDQFLPPHVDVLVYSPAVGPTNPERQEAARLNIPQLSFSQMLGRLMEDRVGVSIAGTHGKSTTTALTASILDYAGLAPSAVVGAELLDRGVSGWAGTGDVFVVESCEYQRSFLDLQPTHAAVLAVEPDHFDYYGDFAQAETAFAEFVDQIPPEGSLLINGDCPASLKLARHSSARVATFSRNATGDWWAADLRRTDTGTRFRVFHRGQYFSEFLLQIPGRHNVMNALAAIALSYDTGASVADIRECLPEFRGIRRRFEYVGSWRGITLVDDYAHHPTAVRATLGTAREQFGRRRIWCAFQPHQVSRTLALLDEFAASFREADEILVSPIHAARENLHDEPETVARRLVDRLVANGCRARFRLSLDQMVATLEDEALPGDVLMTMGAGNIDRVHHEFTRRLQRNHAAR